MINGADIVVENFRQGTMANLGLDFDSLHQANPNSSIARSKGFYRALMRTVLRSMR